MPKRARSETPAPQIVVNITTLNNYFAAAPAQPPPAEGPKSLFATNAERYKRVTVVKNGKPCPVYVWCSARDGTLKGGCHGTCTKQFVDIGNFAPADGSSNTQANRIKFDVAHAAYNVEHAAGNRDACIAQRDILERLRTEKCFKCRPDPGHLSPEDRVCKEWYDGMRQAMAAIGDGTTPGCAHSDCPERGAHVWCILTAEHGKNPKKKDAKGKPVKLSDYCRWGAFGGVPAMIEEAKAIEKWTCHCCAALDPSSSSANRCADPEDMPKGKPSGTKEEVKQYNARHMAVRKYPKQQYVDAAKRRVGKCAYCARPVVAGKEVQFDWHHRDESTKQKGGLFGERGGVAGLVHNCTNAAALEFDTVGAFVCIEPLYDAARFAKKVGNPTGPVKELLDAEMEPKCDPACKNCHHRHTHKYEPSATVF